MSIVLYIGWIGQVDQWKTLEVQSIVSIDEGQSG